MSFNISKWLGSIFQTDPRFYVFTFENDGVEQDIGGNIIGESDTYLIHNYTSVTKEGLSLICPTRFKLVPSANKGDFLISKDAGSMSGKFVQSKYCVEWMREVFFSESSTFEHGCISSEQIRANNITLGDKIKIANNAKFIIDMFNVTFGGDFLSKINDDIFLNIPEETIDELEYVNVHHERSYRCKLKETPFRRCMKKINHISPTLSYRELCILAVLNDDRNIGRAKCGFSLEDYKMIITHTYDCRNICNALPTPPLITPDEHIDLIKFVLKKFGGKAFSRINTKYLTYELFIDNIEGIDSLDNLPSEFLTQELCEKAIRNNPFLIMEVPSDINLYDVYTDTTKQLYNKCIEMDTESAKEMIQRIRQYKSLSRKFWTYEYCIIMMNYSDEILSPCYGEIPDSDNKNYVENIEIEKELLKICTVEQITHLLKVSIVKKRSKINNIHKAGLLTDELCKFAFDIMKKELTDDKYFSKFGNCYIIRELFLNGALTDELLRYALLIDIIDLDEVVEKIKEYDDSIRKKLETLEKCGEHIRNRLMESLNFEKEDKNKFELFYDGLKNLTTES